MEGGERLNSNERPEMILHQIPCTTAVRKPGTHPSASLFSIHRGNSVTGGSCMQQDWDLSPTPWSLLLALVVALMTHVPLI